VTAQGGSSTTPIGERALDSHGAAQIRQFGSCVLSPTRFHVQEGGYEKFSKEFAARAGTCSGQRAGCREPDWAMANPRAARCIEGYVSNAVKVGSPHSHRRRARRDRTTPASFFSPTVLTDVRSKHA